TWRERCPEYYRDTSHLCGAFFALEISPVALDATALQQMFVDGVSFEFGAHIWPTIVPPPEDAVTLCRTMIDAPPRRASFRAAETTLLVLRGTKQRENTEELFEQAAFNDVDLQHALRDTAWADILDVLSGISPKAWARLNDC